MAKNIVKSETHAPWQREFAKNIDTFTAAGVKKDKAQELLSRFFKMTSSTPMPPVMKTFQDESALDEVGVFTERDDEIRDFLVEFFKPLLSKFLVHGKENINLITPLLGEYPVTIVSNHLSHFDTAAMYVLLYLAGGKARDLANRMVFIAGRLVFIPDFTRIGLYMINSLLVCSKRDMADNPGMADIMTRINMRSFRQSQALQKSGNIIAVFPEGTRSRTGKLLSFVDAVYHYVANKVIVPISLSGTDKILPTGSFLFNAARGKMAIGKPVLVGSLPKSKLDSLPDTVQRLEVPASVTNKKQFLIDSLALFIGQNLDKHQHGTYRNLYKSGKRTEASNLLIEVPQKPVEKITVIGHSRAGTAVATILANKEVDVKIFVPENSVVEEFNENRADQVNFPLFKLPPNLNFTSDPSDIESASILVQGVNPWQVSEYYDSIAEYVKKSNGPIINVIKGFTGSSNGLILEDLEHIYGIDPVRFVALSGANYPDQIMERKFSGYELAAINTSLVNPLVQLFNTGYISCRPAVNPYDVRGIQLGGALKNIYAIGIGLIDGYYDMHLGGNSDNSLFHIADIIYKEMSKVGAVLGGVPSTFSGLSGYADLMLSCFGQDTRDRQMGHDFIMNAEIHDVNSAGFFGTQFIPRLLKLKDGEYPVLEAIHAVIIRKKEPDRILAELLERVAESTLLKI